MYWIDGIQPGRLGVVPCPAGHEDLEAGLWDLKTQGVNVVASLLTSAEQVKYGVQAEHMWCARHGLLFLSFPVHDHGVPDHEPSAYAFALKLKTLVEQGDSVAIHCYAAIGRSPLMAAATMVLMGYTVEDALTRISAARGVRVPERARQVSWLRWFAGVRADRQVV